ncbi:MAG: hypothetical protein UY74_C0015G0013 [Candidatus Kaiserbacteria bacterium GW2011_GWC2_52_8b]|uniref:SsuA/THI5-like domain-containing protein n=1 Tax=Candidatus Kaiserbacteria bacterium GW2011_GWC2_52_8b TaxID=1618676 RepID=A0A0G1XKH9_9BACT|nr:MAG: hypothetical protein UY74_C0015G0013 [Candidatus Kaiserbacteria bacterium GW2011_GWC2_52_8b]
MNRTSVLALACAVGLSGLLHAPAFAVEYTTARPLSQVVTAPVKACGTFPQLLMPGIAWGADEATILANGAVVTVPPTGKPFVVTQPGSIFAQEGLSVKFYREDSVIRQLEDLLACRTPFLRMTDGMLAQAGDVLSRIPVVAIYKLSDSVGGDVLVVRDRINELKDIKKVAMQVYGPHVAYFATLMKTAKVDLGSVQIVWVKDITEGDTSSQYPAKALREDPTVDAAFVISPDAAALMSDKTESGGVKGAHDLFSTKLCDTCIADLYVVRKDWADANPQTLQKVVHGLLRANEATQKLFAEKATRKDEFEKLMKASAKMLLDDVSLTGPAADMWGDLRMAGFRGNMQFFTDDAWPRNFNRVMQGAGEAMTALKLISKPATFATAALDYAALSTGLSDAAGVDVSRWNKVAVEALMRDRKQKGTENDGEKFYLSLYVKEFDEVIDLAATYGGLLITITGHVDPQSYLKAKYGNGTPKQLSDIRQIANTISGKRAFALRDALLKYAESKGVPLDPNQFEIIGAGFMKSSKPGCKIENGDITVSCAASSALEMQSMRRAEIRAVNVTAEMEQFEAIVVKQ